MNDILYHLCRHCVGIMDGWHPYPAWAIAKQCNISVSTARRRLRKLKQEGYVDTISEHASDQDRYAIPYNGWTVTKKAFDTPEYKAAEEKEKQICREVFGADMFPDETVKLSDIIAEGAEQ